MERYKCIIWISEQTNDITDVVSQICALGFKLQKVNRKVVIGEANAEQLKDIKMLKNVAYATWTAMKAHYEYGRN